MSIRSGFTLLETTIVVGIASLLLTIGSNLFLYSKQSARDVVRKTDIDQLRAGLEFFREENSNKYYPESLNELLTQNGGYIDQLPEDPVKDLYTYFYERDIADPTYYILGAKLETGGPSSCGNCGNGLCNYCYTPLGLLVTPTPTQAAPTSGPTNTPIPNMSQTPTPTQGFPPNTPTPTQGQGVTCNQIGSPYFEASTQKYVVTLSTNFSNASWSILNILDCTPLAGSGSIFSTKCIQQGFSTATVSVGQNQQNTCQFTTVP